MNYFTNQFKWRFYHSDRRSQSDQVLSVQYRRYWKTPTRDTINHTYVEVGNISPDTFSFDDFLFLRKPSETISSSDPPRANPGYICLGSLQKRTLFLKGMVVRRYDKPTATPSDLVLGYNVLSHVHLSRDRTIGASDDELCRKIYQIFALLLRDTDHSIRERAASCYLSLFLEHPYCLDVRDHQHMLHRDIAVDLFKRFTNSKKAELRVGSSAELSLWAYREGEELSQIIGDLGYVPCPAPKSLYDAWERHKLVRTIFDERKLMFELCASSSATSQSLFARHTFHLLEIFRQVHASTRYTKFEWKDAQHLNLDDVWTSGGMLFNDRCLLQEHVHGRSGFKHCPTFTARKVLPDDAQQLACDCAALWLARSSLNQILTQTQAPEETDSAEIFHQTSLLFPRDFSSEAIYDGSTGDIIIKLAWSVQTSVHCAFSVHLAQGDRLHSEGAFEPSPRLIGTAPGENAEDSRLDGSRLLPEGQYQYKHFSWSFTGP